MKMKTAFVFIPKFQLKDVAFLEGKSFEINKNIVFFVTNYTTSKKAKNCIGFCSENTPNSHNDLAINNSAWVHVNTSNGVVTINDVENELDVTCVHYNYESFKNTEIIESRHYSHYDSYFKTLVHLVQNQNNECSSHVGSTKAKRTISNFIFTLFLLFNFMSKYCHRFKSVMQQSAILNHLNKDVQVCHWMLNNAVVQKRFSVKITNELLSKLLDVCLGLISLYYFVHYKDDVAEFIENSMMLVISNLKCLLMILMGSPAGLKLNYAFNKTLGTFAFYNIALWRAFVLSISPLLKSALNFLVIPFGVLGLSYQVALFEDILAFTTFHVYCIYVYAARLYGLQIKALISLWRLFIGRKFNPLRSRVDSCQYSHHQLFIGTLGFTIIVFLLPTTLLYYAVFTSFRISTIVLTNALGYLQFALRFFPLNILILWLCNSEKIRGAVFMEAHIKNDSFHHLEAKLQKLPLKATIAIFTPQFLRLKSSTKFRELIRKVVQGDLI